MIEVRGMDHMVVLVSDVERALRWYVDKLGLEPLRVEQWRSGEAFFPSVRVNADTIIDLFAGESSGTNVDHFALRVDAEPGDLQALVDSGEFDVVRGPVEVWGAHGDGTSVYVRDPDGNQVELKTYP